MFTHKLKSARSS